MECFWGIFFVLKIKNSVLISLIRANPLAYSHKVENPFTPSSFAHKRLLHCPHSNENSFWLFSSSKAYHFATRSMAFSHNQISPLEAILSSGSGGNEIVGIVRFWDIHHP